MAEDLRFKSGNDALPKALARDLGIRAASHLNLEKERRT
jgi:hypothetical protein